MVICIVLAVAIAALTFIRERRLRRLARDDRAEAAAVLASLEALSLELRCGASPGAALRSVGHASSAAGLLLAAAGRAVTMTDAAAELDRGPPAMRALAGAIRLSEAAGTSLAGLTEALSGPLRDQRQADRELADALAGVRSSADLLTGLPLLGILLAAGIGAKPLTVLLHTTVGSICLVLGVGLASLGRFWTGSLVERARQAGQV